MLSPGSSEAKEPNADRLAQARRKFLKYQSKKNKARETNQQASDGDSIGRQSLDTNVSTLNDIEETDKCKQELGRALERIRQLEIEIKYLRNENRELHQLMESEVFADPLTTFDGHLLGKNIIYINIYILHWDNTTVFNRGSFGSRGETNHQCSSPEIGDTQAQIP
ncbi:hypothetical protein BCR43DRAFT_488549 [Syncephalastrum racemosum]|uniref:Uncharacterized protein n=1 Tax=Syncephalastrum racemosum TaxID=13706 RepID=A0A1X2HK76_SYNRA|nr:hypothetical protein BCR43DRAFT_488549 [Syncephalastrum racemosum]